MMILSTEENPVVARRAEKLKLDVVHGAADKALVLEMVLSDRNIKAAHVAYLGNDENDAECLKMVGLPVVVADAHPSVAALAKSVLRRKGGDDAVREFADAVLEAVQMGKVVVS
jgi:N-acylneuraminate cytidylyltransferase